MINYKVALIGLTNSGKSTLFNRLTNSKSAIFSKQQQTTRDRLIKTVNWKNKKFDLIDCGGYIFNPSNDIEEKIVIQTNNAIAECELIVFLIAHKEYVEPNELRLVRNIQKKFNKKIILAVNKCDNKEKLTNNYCYSLLGIKDIFYISALHGINIGDLLNKILFYLPKQSYELKNKKIILAIIGKTNVGKSSIINAITNSNRVIISNQENTTLGITNVEYNIKNYNFVFYDSAGILKNKKMMVDLNFFSFLRIKDIVKKSEIVLLVVNQELTKLDAKICSLAFKNYKTIIVVVNKIDLFKNFGLEKENIILKIRKKLFFIPDLKIIFISAKTKKNINKLLDLIVLFYERKKIQLKTNVLNQWLYRAITTNPPSTFKNKQLKIKYIFQIKNQDLSFKIYVNDKKHFHFSYERYLINQLKINFNLKGLPIKIIAINK